MFHRPTALERAFELAKSGQVTSVAEIVKILQRDGYGGDQVKGPMLKRQLNGLIQASAKAPQAPDDGHGEARKP